MSKVTGEYFLMAQPLWYMLSGNRCSKDEIYQFLIDDYNKDSIGTKIVPENLRERFENDELKAAPLATHKIKDINDFLQNGGGVVTTAKLEPNIQRIQTIGKTQLKDIRNVVNKWITPDLKQRCQL
jgi:hypothetical protein